jgi:glycosyltransferase involved in cell wall biosynthesis
MNESSRQLRTALLTIAIPTFNRATLLPRALESALAQTSERIVILVSDNGSTDNTQEVLAQYSDRRLRSVRRESTVPRAQHGTLIFSEIETEFILVLSDDDFIEPEFSSEILKLFDEHPELSFAYTGCIEHYDDLLLPALVGPRIEPPLEFVAAHFSGKRHVSWCACVTRVADLRRFGPQPDDRIIGDMYFWTKIAFLGPVGCISHRLSHYTVLVEGGDNESRTTPIIPWARDVKRLTDEVMTAVKVSGATVRYQENLMANMGKYVTRSIANQFMWARLFGMTRLECLTMVGPAFHFGRWNSQSITRVGAALLLGRKMLRKLILRGISRLALERWSN